MIPLLAEGNVFGNVLMLAGVALLLTVLMYNLRKRSQGRSERADPREKFAEAKQAKGMSNDLREMMVELENVTRQFSSQLDAKSRKLEQLIEQADERIEALQRASGGAAAGAREASAEKPARPSAVDLDSAVSTNTASEEVADAVEAALETSGEPTPVARKVYQLADAGCDASQIARELNEHIGKVELILALRQEESA